MADVDSTRDDPYEPFRSAGHAVMDLGFGPFRLLTGYDDVRAAARDWRTFTSDTPFEVPIPPEHDLRPVRQLPIECDPPDHSEYRSLVADRFSRSAVELHAARLATVIDSIIEGALGRGVLDVIPDLGVPVVNAALAAALGRAEHEAEQWAGWGVHVFDSADGGRTANDELNAYLEQAVDAAIADPGDDFFGSLATARFRGRTLTRDEMLGFGNLVFAGGRDTVISSIACAVWHLANTPDDWRRLRADPDLIGPAVEEILRVGTPLPFIGRHATTAQLRGGAEFAEGDLVALGFAAANRDPAVFDDPGACRIDRQPNRHIAFGHGPHTCLGSHLARMEIRVTVERLLALVGAVEPAEPARHRVFPIGDHLVPYTFDSVVVTLSR
ncbi:MAG: cytochrome P450 [Acidimicrobiia bacterium]|nr:cytochrome P450 [Acidimicrobiia bacterium]